MDYASHSQAVEVSFNLELDNHRNQSYTTGILDVDYDWEALVLKITENSSLHVHFGRTTERKASAHFEISHQYYQRLHKAIDYVSPDVMAKLLPKNSVKSRCLYRVDIRGKKMQNFVLDGKYQLEALRQMLNCSPHAPYLLLGPFGTGKTYVLAAAVARLLEAHGDIRVLVCTHLNRGADGLYNNLQNNASNHISQNVVRLVPNQDAAYKLRLIGDCSYATVSDDRYMLPGWNVVITTFGTALLLFEKEIMSFTHILIDEGAQCPEPEALGALVLAKSDTKVIIVGDNKQVHTYNYCLHNIVLI